MYLTHLCPPSKLNPSHRSPSASACPVLTKPNPNQLHHQPAQQHVPVFPNHSIQHCTSPLHIRSPEPTTKERRTQTTSMLTTDHRQTQTIDTRALSHAMLRESPPGPFRFHRLLKKGKEGVDGRSIIAPFFSCVHSSQSAQNPVPGFPQCLGEVLMAKVYLFPQ